MASEPSRSSLPADSTWLALEPAVCGEVGGRVLDQAGQHPVVEAYVSLDSSSRTVATDSLGRFRFEIHHDEHTLLPTRPAFLRIRRIGSMEVRFFLPAGLGYAVEVQLPSGGMHFDHFAAIRIKSPAYCANAPDSPRPSEGDTQP